MDGINIFNYSKEEMRKMAVLYLNAPEFSDQHYLISLFNDPTGEDVFSIANQLSTFKTINEQTKEETEFFDKEQMAIECEILVRAVGRFAAVAVDERFKLEYMRVIVEKVERIVNNLSSLDQKDNTK